MKTSIRFRAANIIRKKLSRTFSDTKFNIKTNLDDGIHIIALWLNGPAEDEAYSVITKHKDTHESSILKDIRITYVRMGDAS